MYYNLSKVIGGRSFKDISFISTEQQSTVGGLHRTPDWLTFNVTPKFRAHSNNNNCQLTVLVKFTI